MPELSWKQTISTSFENGNLMQLKIYCSCLYVYVCIRFVRFETGKSGIELNSSTICSLRFLQIISDSRKETAACILFHI